MLMMRNLMLCHGSSAGKYCKLYSLLPAAFIDHREEDELDHLLIAHARGLGGVLQESGSAAGLLNEGRHLGVRGGPTLGVVLQGTRMHSLVCQR